ncbi:MAG: right-handed parallel beta-helix repeat-containing protein [Clostridiaceae bacterium]|nr:right-handed parallel beta-helix repeat-containing protein [Clostridiaceae bacterium]
MNKSSLFNYSVVTIILLLSLSSFTNVEVKVYGIIFIKADGSIEGTNRIDRKGNLYTFTSDIKGSIEVHIGGIVIDGDGHSIETSGIVDGETIGVKLSVIENITIKNLIIREFTNEYGSGLALQIASSQNILVENCNLTKNGKGIFITDSQNVNVTKNRITKHFQRGIIASGSKNISIDNNYILGESGFIDNNGLVIAGNEQIIISNNNVSSSSYGIELSHSYGAIVFRNYFTSNDIGIYIIYGGENLVKENTVINNERFGIRLSSGENYPANIIYHNNFIDNNMDNISEELQVSNPWFFGPESNIWDNGQEGNFWSDYTLRYPNVTRKETPEIWLIDFFINPENIDNYPLVNPWIPDTTPPIISVTSPQNKRYTTTNIPINCSINEAVEEITYSIDGHEKTTFTENFTLTDFSEGEHNLIIYATDIFGNVGSSVTLFFTVDIPESFPTTIVVVSIVIVVVGLGIFTYFKKRSF